MNPVIFQLRKAPEFVAKDRRDDDSVFFNRQYIYGADMRCALGFGLPQMCWGSKQALNAANHAIARAATKGMKGDGRAIAGRGGGFTGLGMCGSRGTSGMEVLPSTDRRFRTVVPHRTARVRRAG